jgi:ABC-2 type transport system permease protein
VTAVVPSRRRFSILVRHELRRAVNTAIPRVVFAVMPIGLVVFLRPTYNLSLTLTGSVNRDGGAQALPGIAIMFAFVVLVFFGYSAFDDFGFGMWDRLRVTGVRAYESIGAKATAMFVHLLLHLTLVFAVGWALLGFSVEGNVLALIALLVVTALMASVYAFMAFALSSSNALYNVFCYVGALALSALGGGLVPFAILPGWAKDIAPATPIYWALQGCRDVVIGTADSADVMRHLVALLGFTLLFALIGIWRYDPDADREAFNI